MSNLLIAFAIALGLIAISYLLLSNLGVSDQIAVNVSAAALGFIPQLREYLEKRKESANARESFVITSFDGFGLPMSRLLLYASLLMFAAVQFTGLIGGFVHGMVGKTMPGNPEIYSPEELKITLGVFVIIFAFPLIFMIGRWVGKIYISNGPITIVLAALLAQISGRILAMFTMSEQEYAYFYPVENVLSELIVVTVLFSIIGLIGFWWGRKLKLLAYVSYLLKQLAPEARTFMVTTLFEEIKKISHTQMREALDQSPQPARSDSTSHAAREFIAAVIVGIDGSLRGKQFTVKKGILRIGSNPANDLVIKGDPHVSRYHAYLRYGQDGLSVVDQKSTNGTYLNDHRLTDVPMTINIGDRIRIGNSIFEVLPPPSCQ